MIETIIKLAEEAGEATLEYFGKPIEVEAKADDSPLTRADLASHNIITRGLAARFPEIPVVSEEDSDRLDPEAVSGGRYWLVDPLDGTKEFIKRTGFFTVNIALVEEGIPVLGVVLAPAKNILYWGDPTAGAWMRSGNEDARRIEVSGTPAGSQPVRVVASRDHAGPKVKTMIDGFPGAELVSIGSSLKFCLVAEGRADVYLRDLPTMEWDTAAGHAVVRAAGGEVYDPATMQRLPYGKPQWRNTSFLVTSSPALREKVAAILGA